MPPSDVLPSLTLVLGGARSGKSHHAQMLAESASRAGGQLLYIATAEAGDTEMQSRIARHRADRGNAWRTIEAPLDLAGALREANGPGNIVLVDCLTLWVSNLMAAEQDVAGQTDELIPVLTNLACRTILVSNEVGLGIVPDNVLARAFRDHAGRLHQTIAQVADQVLFIAAGLPMRMK